MHHGPKATEKKAHADLSEELLTADMWADIGRKTLIVAVVSFTVWTAKGSSGAVW
jgi:hypothetical protein